MAKFNAKENDPERYARVKEEQAKLQTRCKSELRLARLCPYCDYKLSMLLRANTVGQAKNALIAERWSISYLYRSERHPTTNINQFQYYPIKSNIKKL